MYVRRTFRNDKQNYKQSLNCQVHIGAKCWYLPPMSTRRVARVSHIGARGVGRLWGRLWRGKPMFVKNGLPLQCFVCSCRAFRRPWLEPPAGSEPRRSLPLEAVSNSWEEEKTRKRGVFSGVGAESADREKGIKNHGKWENGIQIAIIIV